MVNGCIADESTTLVSGLRGSNIVGPRLTAGMTTSATFDFTGSVVLVTGAGTGIGRAIAQAFLDAGASVAVTGRRQGKLEEAFADAPQDRVLTVSADVSDGQQVRDLVTSVRERFGRLDVVVSNAAGYNSGEITDLADDDWAAMRATNVDGFFHLAKTTLPVLAEYGGSLVAVSSVSGERGDWGQAGYNATKATVSNFVRSLALDWGTRGVRLNAVAPALTDTELTHAVVADDELRPQFENRTGLGRVGQPEDIAPAVLFLASDAAAYVTGVVLPVDGGTMASTGQAHAGVTPAGWWSAGRDLREADVVAVAIADEADLHAAADVGRVLHERGAGRDELVQARPDVVARPVDDRAGHALRVPVRVEGDLGSAGAVADVVGGVGVRLAEQGGVRRSGGVEVADGGRRWWSGRCQAWGVPLVDVAGHPIDLTRPANVTAAVTFAGGLRSSSVWT